MLRTPMYLRPARDTSRTCELRDGQDLLIGGGFNPREGSEVLVRCNGHDALVVALKTARTALLDHGGGKVAPAVMVINAALGSVGVEVPK